MSVAYVISYCIGKISKGNCMEKRLRLEKGKKKKKKKKKTSDFFKQ